MRAEEPTRNQGRFKVPFLSSAGMLLKRLTFEGHRHNTGLRARGKGRVYQGCKCVIQPRLKDSEPNPMKMRPKVLKIEKILTGSEQRG